MIDCLYDLAIQTLISTLDKENSLAKDKKLDDDEDRRNPQYIPKRGTFYEHDDRTMMDDK
ncbi:Protein casc3 [Homalodisca vitripennis]|nr:Protein casc3 [Homalodisca vitripennis]